MTYVFDNSPLSTLFRNYYRGRFPSLWQCFDDLAIKGDIVSTREVLREIEDGPIESLREWAVQNGELFTTPNAEEGAFVARIYAVQHFQQNIERQKISLRDRQGSRDRPRRGHDGKIAAKCRENSEYLQPLRNPVHVA